MIGLNLLLLAVTALGCLPLLLFLKKRNAYHRLLAKGERTNASISRISSGVRGRYGVVNEKVSYVFTSKDGRQFGGGFVTTPRKHRRTDSLEVYYLPENPAINSVKTAGYGAGYLLLFFGIALAVAFMMYKVYQQIN